MGMLLSKPVLRLLAVILHRGEARRLVRLIQERHGEAAGGWLLPVDDTAAGDGDDAGATVATREWTESHPHCAHAHCSCTKNALRGLIDTFVLGYGAKAIMGLVLAIGSGSAFRSPKRIAIALGFDSIRFGAFLATFVGGFKGLQVPGVIRGDGAPSRFWWSSRSLRPCVTGSDCICFLLFP